MIKLLRVDHRLLHGQVAFSWKDVYKRQIILTIIKILVSLIKVLFIVEKDVSLV